MNDSSQQGMHVCYLPDFHDSSENVIIAVNQGMGIGLLNLTNFSIGCFELQHNL